MVLPSRMFFEFMTLVSLCHNDPSEIGCAALECCMLKPALFPRLLHLPDFINTHLSLIWVTLIQLIWHITTITVMTYSLIKLLPSCSSKHGLFSPRVKTPWGTHQTSPSFCITHTDTWAKAISWMSFPFPKAGITLAWCLFCFVLFYTCTTRTLSLSVTQGFWLNRVGSFGRFPSVN